MEEKEIDIMSRNWSRNTSNKVVKEKTKKVSKNRVQKIIKKYTFVGAFAIVLGMNAKNAIDDIQMNIAVEEAFEPIEQAAQQIVSSNASIAFKGANQPQSQYDHLEIAQDIRAFTEQYGELKGDALLAAVIDRTADTAYQNDDRIVAALNRTNGEPTTVADYVHARGYENEKEYLEAMKQEIYDELQKDEVREKYDSLGGMHR